MPEKNTPERIRAAFREAEASVALEGLDPSGPAYNRAKELLIAGEITFEQGLDMIRHEALQEARKGAA